MLARADEGKLPVRPEPLDAARAASRRPPAASRRVPPRRGASCGCSPPDGLALQADRLRAEQALANLVDNALRYGDGAVELAAEPAGGGVRLHVRDRGPGLDPRSTATRSSASPEATEHARAAGTGLGLAIVDAIARSHGGRAPAETRVREAAWTPGSSCRTLTPHLIGQG